MITALPDSVSIRADLFAAPREGMQRALRSFADAGESILRGEPDPGDMVSLLTAERLVEANAKVIHTADEMIGTLLDRKA